MLQFVATARAKRKRNDARRDSFATRRRIGLKPHDAIAATQPGASGFAAVQ
jgi:hypothetical protein